MLPHAHTRVCTSMQVLAFRPGVCNQSSTRATGTWASGHWGLPGPLGQTQEVLELRVLPGMCGPKGTR